MTAGRVAIRAQRPWYENLVIGILSASLLFACARYGVEMWQTLRYPELATMRASLTSAQARLDEIERDNARLYALVQAGSSHLQIERAAQDQLSKQVRQLSEENARLKQDLAVFEGLSSPALDKSQVVVSALSVSPDVGAGRFRYRATFVLARGRGGKEGEFRGRYLIRVTIQRAGQAATMTIPQAGESNKNFTLRFRQSQSVEGVFDLPVGGVPLSVEAQALVDDAVRASKSISL